MWHEGTILLDEYRVVRRLGVGGMASTFELQHVDDGQRVAVKVPHGHLLQTARQRLRFAAEVQVWASLPPCLHVVQCLFVREVEGAPAVFCEFVASDTLASWQKRQRINGLPHVLDLAIQWAFAMSVAHQRGVVHRDVKPSNCLMDEHGQLKVSDFGLAAAIAAGSQRAGEVGTIVYCSPEQYDGLTTDGATDLWSFGVSLLELVSGKTPGVGPAAAGLLARFAESPDGKSLPAPLLALLGRLLARSPADRPGSFDEVRRELESIYTAIRTIPYPRSFPQLAAPAPAPAQAQGHGSRSTGLYLLEQAMRQAGRDPREAARFVEGLGPSDRRSKAGRLVELAILKEAKLIYTQAIEQQPAGDPLLQLAGVHKCIGMLERELGNLHAAVEAFAAGTDAIERAIALGAVPEVTPLMLGQELHNLAAMLRQVGRVSDALAAHDRAKAAALSLAETSPHRDKAIALLAQVIQSKSRALGAALRYEEAQREADAGLNLIKEVPADSHVTVLRAGLLVLRGLARRQQGALREAMTDYTTAIDMIDSLDRARLHSDGRKLLLESYQLRSAGHGMLNNPTAGHADADHAVRIAHEWHSQSPAPETTYLYSNLLNNRSMALRTLGRHAEARLDIDRCIELREAMVLREGMTQYAHDLARAYVNRALVLIDLNEPDTASQTATSALSALAALVGRTGRDGLLLDVARLKQGRGMAHLACSRFQEGIADLQAAAEDVGRLLAKVGFDGLGVISQSLDVLHRCTIVAPALGATCVAAVLAVLRSLQSASGNPQLAGQTASMLAPRRMFLTQMTQQHGTTEQNREMQSLISDQSRTL